MDRAYKNLKMSEQKKFEMIHAVKHGGLRKQGSYVGIVAPMFVMIAIFFFVISGQSSPNADVTTGAGLNLSEHTHEAYFKEYLILWTVSLLLLMTAYVQFLLLARNPKRLINYRIFRFGNRAFHSWRMVLIGAIPFLWITIESIIIMLFPYDLVVQFFVVLLLFLNMMLIQLAIVKDRSSAKCPHCGVELTNKEIFWNKKCGVCRNGRFRKVQTSIQDFFATSGYIFIMFLPMIDFSLIYFFIFAAAYMYFTMKYIMPYLYVFQKEDEIPPPLW